MSVSVQDKKLEIKLNQYGELVEPKIENLLNIVDNTREIDVDIFDTDPISGYIFVNFMKIKNYGDHLNVIEKYRSPLGEIQIEKTYENVKPSELLKLLFPHTFK
jgi:predicted RNA binding protein with dsRBD fold (UPF0201 family)